MTFRSNGIHTLHKAWLLRSAQLLVTLSLLAPDALAQPFEIFNGTSYTCAGAFLDSGGQGASGYGNDEDFTYTLCPDAPDGAISLNFITFNLATNGQAPIDFMAIYDGNSTAAPLIGTWTGSSLQGQVISASGGNPTGCLTVVFHSNNVGLGVFAASITCYEPCDRPTAVATFGGAAPQRICPGESVSFNAGGSFAAPGFSIASRRWDFGDGTILNNAPVNVNHTYAQPGGYTAQLYVVDNNGCASTNLVDLLTLVGTEPTFPGTTGQLTGCAGETLCLTGDVTGTTWSELDEPNLGDGVFLPDNPGECFTSEIVFTQFAPGQTLTNINGLLSICMDIEHSYIGDLVISIISPTGETVIMHQQGGGETFLGVPIDNELQVQGECWQYCWSPTATNGTWVANAGGFGSTLPSGTYASLNPLSGLVGSHLNGTWTIRVCDMWGSDNGFICNWGIDFNPALFDDLIEFTPVYGANCDSSYWTGPNITSTNANCDQICVTPPGPGSYNYVYHVTDNFGCDHDTTLTVTVFPPPQVTAGPDASTCNTPVQLGASVTTGGIPTSCNYVLTLYDTFGDGWTNLAGNPNGSNVTITVNGVPSSWTLPNGSQGSVNIPVTSGNPISLNYTTGVFNGEQSYTLFNSSGGVVYDSPNGPAGGLAWSGIANCPPPSYSYSWSPTTGLNNPNIANPIATIVGTTQYCVTVYQVGHPACTTTDCVTITVDQSVSAGTNGAITLCSNSPAANLFSQLGGSPTAGGTWAAPGGGAHSGMFVPGVDAPGVYTYTVGGTGACGIPVNSTVTVTVNPLPNAGSSTSITFCSTDGGASLFPLIGGSPQAGGTWSGPSPLAGGMFNPAVHSPGVYTYTVPGTAPCPNATATVTVSVNQPLTAGTNGSITLCASDAPEVLFTHLGGSPDPNGTWSGPSTLMAGVFDPVSNAPGIYTYTVSGAVPCPDASTTVTVGVNAPADAGTDGTITLCSTDAPASLFAQLGGTPDASGSWSGPSPVAGGMINPATMSAGVYTYTVTATAPCPNATATVTVTISTPPDPGTDGSITLCSTDALASLFAQLGGTPDAGGTWTGPSPVAGGMFDPATMSAGVYTYTVTGTAPCSDESATVTVTINTPPDPGTDGAITLCSTDAAASLFAQLGGTPDAGGTWTGPSPVAGGMIDPATMSAGVYTYTVAGTAPCPDETATVTVTINVPPDPGTDGAITLCSTDALASLFAQLGGTPDASGTWTGPSLIAGGMFDPATMSAGVYTYTVIGTAPCPDESATVTVTINTPPDPGTDGAITLCSTDAAASLFAQLGGTPDAGGTWTGPSPVAGGMIDPATMSAGVYTYTVAGTAPCPDETATVTVTINVPPDPGTDGTITLCSTDAPASLFAQLGGTPDASGTWTGPSPVAGGMFDPATMSAGVYTYTVTGTAPCSDESATVTVTINTPPDPGTDGAITLCSTDAAASLFAQLGGTPDAGGTWSGPSPVAGGMIDPATMSAGVYTYTVAGTAPCPDETATVTVTINVPPDPGTDGTITLCSTDAPASLFAQLGGTPDASGTWTGPSPVAGGMFDPATMSAGVYTYTVTGTAPCSDESATVTVTINTPPDPGTDGAITLCSTDAAASLFAQLGGTPDAGGTWSGPSPVAGGMIDPAAMSAGVYTYTVAGTAPCPHETATVTVTINAMPDAGIDGGLTLCSSSPATALVTGLNGTPDAGGTWTGPGGAPSPGTFTPGVSTAGIYTYAVNGTAPCPAVSAQVDVSVVTNPNAGTPGAITLCATDAAALLFDELGGTPDAGGNWSGPSPVVGGQYDPATMAPGVYTYTIVVPPPCVNASSTVTVTGIAPPNAGTDGAFTLCISSPATALVVSLGGAPQAGGTWSGPSPVAGGMFDPATMSPGDYTYTVNGAAPCPNDAAIVTVTVVSAPDAGTPGNATLCATDAAIDLFGELGGTPDAGGAWSGPSPVVGGQYDPATMAPGVYTYTIVVPPPCVNASSTVTVTEIAPPNAGTDGALTLCISSPATALIASLGGAPQAGGAWNGPSPVAGGLFNPATMIAGDYTYTVNGAAPCPNDAAIVTVNVVSAPDAGTPGNATLCATDAAIDLFSELGGTPDAGGNWSGPSTVVGGQYDPATMAPGVYTYTIVVPPPCVNATSTVTIAVVQPPNAGTDGALTLCISSPATALIASLGGSPQAGGTWSGPSAVAGGMFNPATMIAGDYTYTVNGTAPCPNDAAIVTVNVVSAPDAGTPGNATLCATDAAIDLFSELGGTPDAGGNWSGPSAVVGGSFDPATMSAGLYTYTIVVPPPCVNATSTVTIAVVQPPNAGTDGALTLCISSPAGALIAALGGAPQAGGTWSGPSPVGGDLFNPATMIPGGYTYTVNGTAPCPSDAAVVTVNVVTTPDPGTDGSVTLCMTDAAADLFTELSGTPDAGGTWTAPGGAAFVGTFDPAVDASGVYTYTIVVPPPCTSVSATVTVNTVQPPDAGEDGALTLCISSPATALFASLGGTPDAGGAWTGPSAVAGGLFNPATMNPGGYTYTVNGAAPCPADAATVSVSVVNLPDAGGPGFITLCATDDAVDLFTSLEGSPDQGGGWTTPSGGAFSGTFDPGVDVPGVYTYTITVPPPCASVSATVTVDIVQPPNAGIDGALTLCISSPSTPLLPVIGGTPDAGGTWSAPGGGAFAGSFDPAMHAPGGYSYTVAGTTPCPADIAIVTVTVVTTPDPGLDGTVALCASDDPSDLFNSLLGTPDVGGTWTAPGGSAFGGTFDPESDATGVYTYTIAAPPPCASVSATVTVDVVQPPDAGTDGTITVCATGAPADLFLSLLGTPDAGGTWSGPGGAFSGTFDPATDVAGTYTYTLEGTKPCPPASASVTVSITQEPDAGNDAILNLCISGDPVDVFPSLGGADPGGTWTGPGGIAFGGIFTPGSDASGDYTYTVTGTPPCLSGSAVITVTQLSNADAGADGSTTLCSTNAQLDLFTLLQGTPDPGGIWLSPSGASVGGTFDPTADPGGAYTYVLTVPLPCINDTALVQVDVVPASDAGTDGSATLCSNDLPLALFSALGGTPDPGGGWNGPDGPSEGSFTPGTDTPGAYLYTVPGTVPCPNVSAVVDVAVNPLPDAGTNGSITLCPEAAPIELFTLLGGTPMAGGTWTGPGGAPSDGIFDPASSAQGVYTYTVFGLAPCPNALASSTATVFLIAPPNAGPDAVTCTLTFTLNATGNWASGTWSGPAGIVFAHPASPTSTVTSIAGGTYTFTWSVLSSDGCATEDQVAITFTEAIVPLVATTDAICNGACDGTASVEASGGNIDVDGYSYAWSNGIAANMPTATGVCAGSYTVTVFDMNGCNTVAPFIIGEPVRLVIDAVGSTPETCPGSCDGIIAVIDPEGAQYSITGGAPFQAGNVFSGLCAGEYAIVMIDANGCQASTTETVGTPPPVIAGFIFNPDTLFVDDPTTQFTNLSSFNAVNFIWDFGGLGTSTAASPQLTFPGGEGGIYDVCLIASDANGCPDTACAPITIYDLLTVFVPNAFTPNGDGFNDGFAPVFNLPWVVDYEFMIFDRWGELLHKSVTVGEEWDAWYGSEMVETEVYVWKLKCRDALSGKWIEAVGHVTVLK